MKLLSFVLLVVAAVAEIHSPACPSNPAGRPWPPEEILPYYKYSYEMDKSGSLGVVYIEIDSDERASQVFWFRVTADATTANTASMNVRLNVTSDPNTYNDLTYDAWCGCDMSPDGEYYRRSNLSAAGFNVAAGRYITIAFYPSCPGCRSTVEFSVETAWITNNVDNPEDLVFPPIPVTSNIRSMVFERNNGDMVNFYMDLLAGQNVLSSIVYDSKFDDDSQTVLYWKKDTPPTTSDFTDHYPIEGEIPGNYLQQRNFTATTAGRWYLGANIAAGTSSTSLTIKTCYPDCIPCSMGSTLSVSSFVFALVALLFFQLN